MNIVYISRVQMNPYVRLLASAMEQIATRVTSVVEDDLSPRWLWERRDELDVLHFHWVELLYASSTWKGLWVRWLRLISTMILAKLLGIKIAYTVHNIAHHEGENAWLNRFTNWAIFELADVIHVHDQVAQQAVAERFGRTRNVFVIPHGNYFSYPNDCTRAQARAKLALPEQAFVYLFLGVVRPYKGVEELIRAFKQLDAADAYLLIAGHAHSPEYAVAIEAMAEGHSQIMLKLGFVPEEMLQYYMNASDICVLPYRHVTTSGAAILAFSFGKPVIAPRLGAFPQTVGAERGILYHAHEPEGLLQALREARYLDLAATGAAAYALAEALDWVAIAEQHLQAYDSA